MYIVIRSQRALRSLLVTNGLPKILKCDDAEDYEF